MGKRSRDGSLSPTGQITSTDTRGAMSKVDSPPEHVAKMAAIDNSMTDQAPIMKCDLPPHITTLDFPSIEAFEIHYAQDHTNRCSECGRNLPSAYFLTLHIDENHNPLREALAAKGEQTYACLLPDCERKCSTPQKRRLHVIDKHHFAKFYDFRVIDRGIDHATSLLREGRRRRVSISVKPSAEQPHSAFKERVTETHKPAIRGYTHVKAEVEPNSASVLPSLSEDANDDGMGNLEASFSALQFVPRSVAARKSRHAVKRQPNI